MTAQRTPLPFEEGGSFYWQFQAKLANGQPKILTDYTARLEIRTGPGGRILAEFSTTSSEVTIDGAAGTVTITLTVDQVRSLFTAALSKGHYNLYITSPTGTFTTKIAYGEAILIRA